MQKYEFTKSVTVDGTPYRAGDVVTPDQIPAGCFESLTRLRQLVEVPEPADPAAAFAAAMSAGSVGPAVEAAHPEIDLEVDADATPVGPVEPVSPPQTPQVGPLVGPPGDPAESKVEAKPEPHKARRK